MVKYLIDKGSDTDHKDKTGFSAITYAVKQNKPAIFLYLILKGADFNIKDVNQCSLLHWAAYRNNLFIFKIL